LTKVLINKNGLYLGHECVVVVVVVVGLHTGAGILR